MIGWQAGPEAETRARESLAETRREHGEEVRLGCIERGLGFVELQGPGFVQPYDRLNDWVIGPQAGREAEVRARESLAETRCERENKICQI